MNLRIWAVLAVVASSFSAAADEGMWTYNAFPVAKLKEKYGFAPTQDWLDHVRLSSARIAGGCSASFVSEGGLVLTNHHCAHSCIEKVSTKTQDRVKDGFYAKTLKDEVKCPAMELNQLVEISDVTARVQEATKGLADAKFNDAQKAEIAKIEKDCAASDEVRCDVVTLYRGGKFDLYKYRRFQDVRLVFAPEFPIAFFGGDPDNFMFPRFDLDMSMLRVYGKDGAPAKLDHFLKFSSAGAKDGDLTFVSGHPGGTSRTLTVAQLENTRETLAYRMASLAEWRGLLNEFQKKSPEAKRVSNTMLFQVENAFKAIKGRFMALNDKAFMDGKAQAEKALRAKVDADPKMKAAYGSAWDGLAQASATARALRKEYLALERGLSSELFGHARALVRLAEELPKPNGERLTEYTDSRLPQAKAGLLAKSPIHPEFEELTLAHSLTKMREELTADHPVVKLVLGEKSPQELASAAVKGTKLADPKVREALLAGGQKAIDASKDPMIALARSFDAQARAIRKKYETEVEGPMKKNGELLAKATFQVFGTSNYPDATFTLRLNFGQVKGYVEDGKEVKPLTTLGGAFARHTGRDPFALPKSWLAAKSKLNLDTPFNMATTNDIIGGNSGSPVVNRAGEIVGLIFDGNIQSLGGDYGFDETVNRAVSVHSAAILEALSKVYGADRVVAELTK